MYRHIVKYTLMEGNMHAQAPLEENMATVTNVSCQI